MGNIIASGCISGKFWRVSREVFMRLEQKHFFLHLLSLQCVVACVNLC